MSRGVPTTAELVEAVSEFLRGDVLPGLDGRSRFDLRVALNVLGAVERELRDGGPYAATHAERLAVLGVDDDHELAEAIRAGDLDGRFGEVVEMLRRSTRERLEFANPRYLVEADTSNGGDGER